MPDKMGDRKLYQQAMDLQTLIFRLIRPIERADDAPLNYQPSARDVRALALLDNMGGTMSMKQLATALQMPKSTLTRIVERLEDNRLVERGRSIEDRRLVVVRETLKGKFMIEGIRDGEIKKNIQMLARLSTGDRGTLLYLLDKLTGGRRYT